MTLWTWIQEHPNLTVGIIGFVGVIFTLWFNAWQAREQRRDERRLDRETLRAALIEELKINRAAMVSNLESVDETLESQRYFVPTDLMDDAYRVFTDRIGLLSQAEVSKVMYAYLSLRSYNAKLFLVGVPTHTSPRHVEVPAKNAPLLRAMQESRVGPLDEAIDVMERARDAD